MKAFILAAGEGTRLRPLTYTIPKPMFPISNKPVMECTLELLRNYGIEEVIINIHYQGNLIRNYFHNGKKWRMKIIYSEEKKLLGTAGGVKKVLNFFRDTFLVMSGDGLTDIGLLTLIDFHRKKKSIATMVLKKIDTRLEYGVTITSKNGKIKKFVEKPYWSDVFSNTVNTGIYVFEPEVFTYVPENTFYDFGHNLWPLLLKKKEKIYAFVTNNYWCDIGNLYEYRQAQRDVLEGKIKIKILGEEIKKNVWIDTGTKVHPSARINAPAVIGKNCLIEKNVVIGDFAVIGNNCRISQGAKVKNSTLWNNVEVEKNVELNNCIIANNAQVKENISVFDGSVINIRG